MTLRWTMGVALVAMGGATASAQSAIESAFDYQLTCCESPVCCDEPSCGCEDPSCGCEPSCGCDDGCCGDAACGDGCCDDGGCCGDACGCGSTCSLFGDCCLGDAWTLQGELDPCGECAITYGGWMQFGYHSDNVRLSSQTNDNLSFNDRPDEVAAQQLWFFAEKVADGSCGADWGFRADIMYGIDAQKTQAFGNRPGTYDYQNGWDYGNGAQGFNYGWAMPQLYAEVAYGDWSVIAGHFYTLIGYEVVTAPDNFFYSHALTMFNSEPFTHTGVLATYSGLDNVEVYAGWTAGWDTGFDQYGDGSSFLGGFSTNLTDDIAFTYIATAGDFGARSRGFGPESLGAGGDYSHSLVFDVAVSDNVNYVLQSDLVSIDDRNGAVTGNDQIGINQYLFYTINDCWAAGTRLEWWKTDGVSYNEVTFGLNYRPHANVVIRPEWRYDWSPTDQQVATDTGVEGYNNGTFGIDAIFTY